MENSKKIPYIPVGLTDWLALRVPKLKDVKDLRSLDRAHGMQDLLNHILKAERDQVGKPKRE